MLSVLPFDVAVPNLLEGERFEARGYGQLSQPGINVEIHPVRRRSPMTKHTDACGRHSGHKAWNTRPKSLKYAAAIVW